MCLFTVIFFSYFLSSLSTDFFYFTVAKFAAEQIAPLVSKMDAEGCIDEKVYRGLFENGVCILFSSLTMIFFVCLSCREIP